MTWVYTPSALEGIYEQRYRAASAPSNFTVLLCSGAALDADSTIGDVEAAEISGNGYSRKTVTFPQGAWDSTQERYELRGEVTFTATGGPITWDTIVLARNSVTGVEAVFNEVSLQSIPDGETRRIAVDFNAANEGIDVSTGD